MWEMKFQEYPLSFFMEFSMQDQGILGKWKAGANPESTKPGITAVCERIQKESLQEIAWY